MQGNLRTAGLQHRGRTGSGWGGDCARWCQRVSPIVCRAQRSLLSFDLSPYLVPAPLAPSPFSMISSPNPAFQTNLIKDCICLPGLSLHGIKRVYGPGAYGRGCLRFGPSLAAARRSPSLQPSSRRWGGRPVLFPQSRPCEVKGGAEGRARQ
ncbi:hypothetical protein DFH09DRAFT_1161229 [Mycena vulgaris]|nr:hypothetical protein DFH09DRAFT_1161229 [Mycena vulgaris]